MPDTITIGRLLRSSTTGFVFGCSVPEPEVPLFGAFVKVPAQKGQTEVMGLIYNIAVEDDLFVRQMVAAPDLDEAYIQDQRANRQVPIEVSVLAVGYRSSAGLSYALPPQPPITLDRIHPCSRAEVLEFTARFDYLRLVLDSPEAVQALHEVPQRVRVEHEPRARHDVGPVARLVLLEEKEALVLLGLQPSDRAFDLRGKPPLQAQGRDGDQPPQRRVDAAEVPEIGLTAPRIDELGDLAVRRLVRGERGEALRRGGGKRGVARERHADGADRAIAAEDRGVAARAGARARVRRQDPLRREVPGEQPQRADAAFLDEHLFGRRQHAHRGGINVAKRPSRSSTSSVFLRT